MAKISKREKENKSKVEAQKFYALNEAVETRQSSCQCQVQRIR